jgi:uncharacterized membrane protein
MDAVTRVIELAGRLHPVLVHFPVALILTACVAEVLHAVRKERYFSNAALFCVTAAAWMSLPAFLAGFAAAWGETFTGETAGAFAVHRVVGIVTPMLTFIAAGMGQSARRSGQLWEHLVYRVFLALAAITVALAGAYGGELVYGVDYLPW